MLPFLRFDRGFFGSPLHVAAGSEPSSCHFAAVGWMGNCCKNKFVDNTSEAADDLDTVYQTSGARDELKLQARKENKQFQQTMHFLSEVPLLKRLPKDQHPILAEACVSQTFSAGEVVIRQGDVGAEFFVIVNGEAGVSVSRDDGEQAQVATLKSGDYFGENALLREEPRAATVTALSQLQTFKITRDKFQAVGLNRKLHFAKRKAVAAGGNRAVKTKTPTAKTDAERKLIAEALACNESLKTMVQLTEERVNLMIDAAWKEEVPAGKALITEGDLAADYFYIVQEGSFEVLVGAKNASTSVEQVLGTPMNAGTLSVGKSFGELALLYLVPRAATVRSTMASVVWVIDRRNFKDILMRASEEKIDEHVKYLNRVKILSPLLVEEKRAVAAALTEVRYSRDEVILNQGELGNTFYILCEGEVAVHVDGEERSRLQASQAKQSAEFFGERALLKHEPRAATVSVTSESAKVLALDRESFQLLLGPLQDIIDEASAAKGARRPAAIKNGRGTSKERTTSKMLTSSEASATRIHMSDLRKIGALGFGGFGAVELWEHKQTGDSYALKCLSKGFIVQSGMQESVINEKNILLMTNSPFITRLYECYNSAQTLYFLMEPALGGELYSTYNRMSLYGSEKHARFYLAGTVCAFEHLHERHIIYRDLKPENLLLSETGRLKLADMGLAKFAVGKTFTTCGTPDYFAPEIIASTGHTIAVDWWTLGILAFELMSGHAPFESAYPMQTYAKVMAGIGKVSFPPKCQGNLELLIKGLLRKDPSERLPMRLGGTKNIYSAKWYANFSLDDFMSGAMKSPYMPVVKSKTDIANFSARPEDMPRRIEYKDDGTGWDKDFAT